MRGQLKRSDHRHIFGVTEVDSSCSVGTGHHEMRLCVMQSHGPQWAEQITMKKHLSRYKVPLLAAGVLAV